MVGGIVCEMLFIFLGEAVWTCSYFRGRYYTSFYPCEGPAFLLLFAGCFGLSLCLVVSHATQNRKMSEIEERQVCVCWCFLLPCSWLRQVNESPICSNIWPLNACLMNFKQCEIEDNVLRNITCFSPCGLRVGDAPVCPGAWVQHHTCWALTRPWSAPSCCLSVALADTSTHTGQVLLRGGCFCCN